MTDAIQKAREALVAARDTLSAASHQLTDDHKIVLGGKRWGEVTSAKIAAALAALDAETEVKVQALEWVEPSRQTNGCWTAPCIFGVYSVVNEGGWYAMLEGGPSGHCFEWYGHDMSKDTLATAKAAAQADFERRIRSALVLPESRS